ncbi:30S ribosomal protein S14 [Jonesia denitrificans]|uniref:Small ribosomal subunit protein uS14 n=1 Tax=Jonesia denitrificans (strain ATCC 14870 / DSM 20603 / BCRC 15368 / CIP 55.134 / JCM 11481 / NBRC 15587 / NCTC 10816 / Prevot 55134) TaxID=471856 RepID=C7R567_JONDD|nr:30S ribosomal protein S14 [Jonesia denitrificans]ACV07745.1 ribosomal protein S14 [Jonesia denitrificans DSM 20603]ASE08535.1 30S ribosomal protein S14 [Jonesia denitrificans]QXB43143.1 30S ribosomal protein S14 [Jonesia denitrificans]SQH19717.1 30S ribosomal protein S14 [Jonesia denitrificans]
MAKTSKIAAQRRRETIVARYAEQRATLKEQARTGATLTERQQALRALSNLPREASPTRLRNRDVADGRPRGYIRKAGVSRVKFRQLALRGELPGITKSSW